MSATLKRFVILTVLVLSVTAARAESDLKFKKVYAFTNIGDDAYAAKLAELNVFAASCGTKQKTDKESVARAKRFGIVPYVGFGAAGSHKQVLSPEESYRQYELAGRFLPADLKGEARDKALKELWRRDHYRIGGEPEEGGFEVMFEGISCFVGPQAREKGATELVKRLKANPDAKAVCLDYIGYQNYRCCYHPECQHLLKTWLKEKGLENNEKNRNTFFEDEIVAYYAALYDAVKAFDKDIVVYAHLYPVFLPNPLYGNRLKLDVCGQTCAWYFRWPQEKVKKYCETVVKGQHDFWPFAKGAPFVAYGSWVKDTDPAFVKTPEDIDRELRTALEAGAEVLAVHEIRSVINDPAVFAVFRKYCSPDCRAL